MCSGLQTPCHINFNYWEGTGRLSVYASLKVKLPNKGECEFMKTHCRPQVLIIKPSNEDDKNFTEPFIYFHLDVGRNNKGILKMGVKITFPNAPVKNNTVPCFKKPVDF